MQFPSEKPGIYLAPEIMENYVNLGCKKAGYPVWKMFLLGILAGMLIGFSAVSASTAGHTVSDPGLARIINGLIFPFGLGIIMLTGTELFTGNTMIFISVMCGKTSITGMLKNWFWVYIGNLCGSVLLAAGNTLSGQMNLGDGALAVYAIKTAAAKCSLEFYPAVIQGIFCNILVCLGVLCSLSAKDTIGRILGAYIPVSLFVIGGFEHCVANMYYIPAGILTNMNPLYTTLASEMGIDATALNWVNFVTVNLLPVTIGNILGGAGVASLLWCCHHGKGKKEESNRFR